ncbi:MAG: ATP synthase F0 subunit C [Candidatus Solibacter sp.]|jgi:F-type H+-transporting ATPase subunit c
MTKKMLFLVALLLLASPMLFGQTPGNPTANGHWVAITAGFSMAIASGLCGLAQARAVAAAAEGMARNPGAAGAIRFALLLGLVLIESLALYVMVIIFTKVA